MKKILSVLLAAALLLSLAACGVAGTPAETGAESTAVRKPDITLVYAEEGDPDSVAGMTAGKFKEEVERLSGGAIAVEIAYSGAEGSRNNVLDAMISGSKSIDIASVEVSALAMYGIQSAALLSVPYTFEDHAHFQAFAGSELAAGFLSEPMMFGLPIHGLFYGEEGFRHFFTAAELESAEDLKGRKLAVQSNDPVMNGLVEGLGAVSVSLSAGALADALAKGDCDGAELSAVSYYAGALHETAPWLLLDGHTLAVFQTVISDNAWSKLSAEQQAILAEAAKAAQAYASEISRAKEQEVLELLKAEGVSVVETVDKTALREACAKVIEKNTAPQAELYEQILAMAG